MPRRPWHSKCRCACATHRRCSMAPAPAAAAPSCTLPGAPSPAVLPRSLSDQAAAAGRAAAWGGQRRSGRQHPWGSSRQPQRPARAAAPPPAAAADGRRSAPLRSGTRASRRRQRWVSPRPSNDLRPRQRGACAAARLTHARPPAGPPQVVKVLGFGGAIPFIALAPPVSKHLFFVLPHEVIDNSASFQASAAAPCNTAAPLQPRRWQRVAPPPPPPPGPQVQGPAAEGHQRPGRRRRPQPPAERGHAAAQVLQPPLPVPGGRARPALHHRCGGRGRVVPALPPLQLGAPAFAPGQGCWVCLRLPAVNPHCWVFPWLAPKPTQHCAPGGERAAGWCCHR